MSNLKYPRLKMGYDPSIALYIWLVMPLTITHVCMHTITSFYHY